MSYNFTRACGITSNVLYAVGIDDTDDQKSTRIYQFHYGNWTCTDVPVKIQQIAKFQRPDGKIAVFMSPKGELFSPEPSFRPDHIIDENLRSSKKLGRLSDLRQIGKYLFACGDGGQTYRRSHDGEWRPLALDLFDEEVDRKWAFAIDAPGATGAEQAAYWRKHPQEKEERRRRIGIYTDSLQLYAINGPSDDNLYICGTKGTIYNWCNGALTKVDVRSSESFTGIAIDDGDRVWICGRGGTLLYGNGKEGFASIACPRTLHYSDMAFFKDKLYLSSLAGPRGLFVYDGKIRQVTAGLQPGLTDVHTVSAVEDTLWVVGAKEIARFDGSSWERIPFPT